MANVTFDAADVTFAAAECDSMYLKTSLNVIKVPYQENAIEHVRSTVCANKMVVACVNEEKMTRAMQLRLYTFIKRELPMGCVLTTANIPNTIPQS